MTSPDPATETTGKKKLFVISPIGKKDESGFEFADLVLEEIIKPAAAEIPEFDIPERADEVQAPGSITARIVASIVNADVCVADLTGRNPNVMYEVAIAHAADRPVILLQQEQGGPPFDFTTERVIHYGVRADLANKARNSLVQHLRNAHEDEKDAQLRATMHPVRTIFKQMQTRATATEPQQAMLAQLDSISKFVETIESRLSNASTPEPADARIPSDRTPRETAKFNADAKRLLVQAQSLIEASDFDVFTDRIVNGAPSLADLVELQGHLAGIQMASSQADKESRIKSFVNLIYAIPPF